MLKEVFEKLNLDEKEYQVFVTLFKIGANPASIVANHLGYERTTTYRILKRLNKIGVVSTTTKAGIQVFFVENENTIINFVNEKKKELEKITDSQDIIQSELKNLRPKQVIIPKIKIYDDVSSKDGNKKIFREILEEIKRQNLTTIRLIASDTFTEQVGSPKLQDIGKDFIFELEKNKVKVDGLVAEGMLTRERIEHIQKLNDILSLPAGNGSTNIYIVGDTVFIILFKEQTIGLQINHPDIAQTLHFLFDQVKRK